MDHIIVSVKSLAEHPEVILIRQPVVEAELLVRLLDWCVNDLIGPRELDPLPLGCNNLTGYRLTIVDTLRSLHYLFFDDRLRFHHDFDVSRSGAAARVKDTVLLYDVILTLQHQLKEASLDTWRDQVVG